MENGAAYVYNSLAFPIKDKNTIIIWYNNSTIIDPKKLKTGTQNVGEDVEKREPSYTVGGNVNDAATVENSMTVSQKTKNKTTILSRNSTPGYISKPKKKKKKSSTILIQNHTCTPIFIAA